MNDHNQHNPELPDELRALETSLDALGQQARASAPDGLGDRIADESAGAIIGAQADGLHLSGTEADRTRNHRVGWRQHWRLAASIALLVVAVVGAIALNPSEPLTVTLADVDADTAIIDDDWIDFETAYVADTGWDDEAFSTLASELDELELSLGSAWTLDENLNLNDGESL